MFLPAMRNTRQKIIPETSTFHFTHSLHSPSMKPSRKTRFFSSSTSTVTYAFQNDHSAPQPQSTTVHLSPPPSTASASAAVKIQSAYRSHIVRTLVKKISAVNSEANRQERRLQQQETVDAVRGDDRERMRMNEALMGLLLRLDSVPGVDPAVRELRRRVSRRIVGLQEILDGVAAETVEEWGGFLGNWDDVLAEMEEDLCRERGGREMERFCDENLGFRCLQRFLRDM